MSSSIEILQNQQVMAESIKRLCHFSTPLKGPNATLEIHSFLVLQAMATLPDGYYSVEQIKNRIEQVFKLQFEPAELGPTLEYLVGQRRVERNEQNQYTLASQTRVKIDAETKQTNDLEKQIFNSWGNSIRDKYQTLTDSDIGMLKTDLSQYLIKIIQRHGAECSVLLCRSNEADNFISQLGDTFERILPDRPPALKTIRQIEFPLFISHLTPEHRKYLSGLLNAGYLSFMLHLDKNCSALAQAQLQNIILYLDTNFLFDLFGLTGEKRRESANLVIDLARKFNCDLVVSSRTIQEWDAAIEIAERELRKPAVRLDLAEIGKRYGPDDDVILNYWLKHGETGISVADYLTPAKHLDDMRKQWKIREETKIWDKFKGTKELEEETGELNKALNNIKSAGVAEHDAFHRLLVLHLRGEKPANGFLNARVWFLTCDSSLLKYHRKARKNQNEMPFCIMAHQWIQLIRPLLPRTDDYDTAFVGLLSSPYLRAFAHADAEVVRNILGRVSQYKQYPATLATRMLMNTNLTEQLRHIPDEQKRYELIDNDLARIAADMEIELKKVTDEKEKEKIRAAHIEKQKQALAVSLQETQKQCSEIQEKWDDEKQQRERSEKIIKYGKIIGIPLVIALIILVLLLLFLK